MFCWITILGGLLIMMGQHSRSEALFYHFRLEDQIPETHLLRLIEKHINFGFVREKVKDSYRETGRLSIDPELLLRILLIGYLYGITSERKWSKSYSCIWPGAGLLDWASIRRFRTTPHFPRIVTSVFRSRSCSSDCLKRSWRAAWKPS
jgi:transposase